MKKFMMMLTALSFALTGHAQAVVDTQSGRVSGIVQEGTLAFLGIP